MSSSWPAPRVAVLFPGLGSQHTGMGRSWYEEIPVFRRTLEEASDHAGLDFVRLCREKSEKARLAKQLEGQLSLFAYGIAAYRALCEHLPERPSHFAGHSLGELTALCAAGGLDFAEGIRLVRRRAEIIAQVASGLGGTMSWVLHLPRAEVEQVCRSWRALGRPVHVSAHDAPEQVAISGPVPAVDEAVGTLERLGALVFPLRLQGPYHSPLMAPAASALASALDGVALPVPAGAVWSNASGGRHPGGPATAALLAQQLAGPVRWQDAVEGLCDDGVGLAIEIGPKAVLCFLAKKIAPALPAVALDAFAHPAALVAAHTAPDPAAVLGRCRRLLATSPARRSSARDLALGREIAGLGEGESERAVALAAAWLAERGAGEGAIRSAVGRLLEGRVLGGVS